MVGYFSGGCPATVPHKNKQKNAKDGLAEAKLSYRWKGMGEYSDIGNEGSSGKDS